MKRKNIKKLLLVIACGAVLCASIASTFAWLADSDDVKNTFTPGVVGCIVNERLTAGAKSEVTVSNSKGDPEEANVPAFMRVALVPVWRDAVGNGTRYEAELPEGFAPANGWFEGGDGYYYYPDPVAPGAATQMLFNGVVSDAFRNMPAAGLQYELQVLAQSIQADGVSADGTPAAEDAWEVVTVNAQGKLVAKP